MNLLKPLFFFLFFTILIINAGSDTTQGGNITSVNVSIVQNATWHGVMGQTSSNPPAPTSINAYPGNLTSLIINTGSGSCTYGVKTLNLLFSNSSSAITSLISGNLNQLDLFIPNPKENATSTFTLSSTFTTANYGSIPNVPTTYTNSHTPQAFKLGYLNDQSGNIVFITPVVNDKSGFNGSLFDFQLMLPTNGTNITYYLTVDLECSPQPYPLPPSGEEKKYVSVFYGFDCKTGELTVRLTYNSDPVSSAEIRLLDKTFPFLSPEDKTTDSEGYILFTIKENSSYKLTQIDLPSPYHMNDVSLGYLSLCKEEEEVEEIEELCISQIYCGEWSGCSLEGTKSQMCWDATNCSDMEFVNAESCIPEIPEIDEAQEEIQKALEEGKDISEAQKKLQEAVDAFERGDYGLAKQLAEEAKQLAFEAPLKAPQKEELIMEEEIIERISSEDCCIFWSLIFVLLLLFILWKRKKRKPEGVSGWYYPSEGEPLNPKHT